MLIFLWIIFACTLTNVLIIDHNNVPFVPKYASIMPLFNKDHRGSVDNLKNLMEQFISKYQCGFRKGFSAQHCLLGMLEKQKRSVDQRKVFGEL